MSAESPISLVSGLSFRDYWNAFLCRVSNRARMSALLPTGLYTLGSPDRHSPVLVTANYSLSVSTLRAALNGRDVWILVVDTKGINVWCAAGKGTFCTSAIVNEVTASALKQKVGHRRLILPQLGASGVNAVKLQKQSGFTVFYGPVRAEDIPSYLDNDGKATKEMRRVQFTFRDRATLIPMEAVPAIKKLLVFLSSTAVLFGISKQGILFNPAFTGILPFILAGITSVLTGAILVPLFLPFIPFRAFALKGFLTGLVGTAILFTGFPICRSDPFLIALCAIAVPAYSSLCAFLFTGSTTYTSPSGVKIELKRAWPLYIASAGVSCILFIIYWLRVRGIL